MKWNGTRRAPLNAKMPATLQFVKDRKSDGASGPLGNSMAVHDHPDFELLEGYVMKHCPSQIRNAIERHLEVCDSCHTEFLLAKEWTTLMKAVLAPRIN
jgi:hypothetical protein